MTRWLTAATLALTFVMAPAPSTSAAHVTPFSGPSVKVTDKHLAPALGKAELAWEKYLFEAWLDDGRRIYWSARFSNMGPGDAKAEVKSRIFGKNLPRRSAKTKRDKGKYTVSAAPVRIAIGDHSLEGPVTAIKLGAKGKNYSFSITFDPEIPAWRPGNGRVKVGSTYFDTTLVVPRGKVTGSVTIDGVTTQVTGYGYGVHEHATMPLHEQAKRFAQVRILGGDTTVFFREFFAPTPKGKEVAIRWLLVAHRNKVLVQTTEFQRKYGSVWADPESKVGYRVPKSVVLRAESGGAKIGLALVAKGAPNRSDELAKMSTMERMIAARFAKPVSYSWSGAQFKIDVTGSQTASDKGKARFDFTQVNP